jgi:hypothetical protein
MAGTVVGVFDNHRAAEEAAEALLDDGVPLADITIVSKEAGGEVGSPTAEGNAPEQKGEEFMTSAVREVPEHDVEQPINTADEAVARAVVGFVIGSPIASLGIALLVYFPFFAGVFTRHPLMPQLGGGIIGGVIGAILGAVTAGGIPNEVARAYHKDVEAGRALVTALSSSRNAPHMQDVLREHGGKRLGFYARFIDTIQSMESENAHHIPAETF